MAKAVDCFPYKRTMEAEAVLRDAIEEPKVLSEQVWGCETEGEWEIFSWPKLGCIPVLLIEAPSVRGEG